MKDFFQAAIENVYKHGDTDILPFPIENRILHDKSDRIIPMLETAFEDFEAFFSASSPTDIRSMMPVHHTGFRWASQLDPFWNIYFLGITIRIAKEIEEIRMPSNIVYSYRLDTEHYLSGTLFRTDVSWRDFVRHTREISDDYEYVVLCDIADCYQRLSHHKIENCLKIVNCPTQIKKAILKYLSYLTDSRSAGLPIGGPAARIIAELALNNPDHLLNSSGTQFVRYADDYHIFANSKSEAYNKLFYLSDILDNEGLSLQRSKTRIVSKSEYANITKSLFGEDQPHDSPIQKLMSIKLRYDPYSPNADRKYEYLKSELEEIDIVGLLNEQLSQSKIHIAAARRIVSALKSIDKQSQFDSVISMLENMDSLFPIASNVFIAIIDMFDNFSEKQKDEICERLRVLYASGHEVMGIESFVAFMVRIIGKRRDIDNQNFLTKVFEDQRGEIVKREIILVFGRWENFPWLSMFRRRFESSGAWERRAFILASFSMEDEGKHWRRHTRARFTEFEEVVRAWGAKLAQQRREIPQ